MKKVFRKDHEPPFVLTTLGWKYHHLGIPTTVVMAGEVYYPHLKIHVQGFSTSPFGIEWMRFDDDCPMHELIRTVPHLCFEVENLDKALNDHDFEVLTPPNAPSDGVRAAMIVHDGAPVELIEFRGRSKVRTC